MTIQAWFVLILTVIVAVLLLTERLRADLVGMLVMVVLGLSGVITPQETFSGFSGPAVMTLVGISIVSSALHRTGVASWLGRWMQRISGRSEIRLTLSVTVVGAALSLFMNNIAAVGVLLPAVTTLARRSRIAPGRLLIPLAYGVILGGMATLLTTSNIIVSDALQAGGFKPFGLLDFIPVGGPVALAGVLFLVTIGRRLLPRSTSAEKDQPLTDRLSGLYRLGESTYQLVVVAGSTLDGHTLVDSDVAKKTGMNIVGLVHEGHTYLAPGGERVIMQGDHLLAQGEPDEKRLARCGLQVVEKGNADLFLADEATTLAEVVISPHARIIGQTLKGLGFRDRFRLNVLAIWRGAKPILSGLAGLRLQFGDALLVQGSAARIHQLREESDLVVLEEDPDAVITPGKMPVAIAITGITLLVASLGILPVAVVVMSGAVLLVLTGCLQMVDIYRTVEWKAIFLIAGMWPLSIALRTTGLAQGLVTGILAITGSTQPLVLALGLILVALLLAQFMSGQVAALVVAPLALAVAQSSGLDARALGMAVALGCSLCFPTPTGHPVNIMVFSLGGYRFRDYLKVGLPLTILSLVLILVGLRVFWGL